MEIFLQQLQNKEPFSLWSLTQVPRMDLVINNGSSQHCDYFSHLGCLGISCSPGKWVVCPCRIIAMMCERDSQGTLTICTVPSASPEPVWALHLLLGDPHTWQCFHPSGSFLRSRPWGRQKTLSVGLTDWWAENQVPDILVMRKWQCDCVSHSSSLGVSVPGRGLFKLYKC